MKFRMQQKGFTLLTAIVSMGILGIVALGFMRMTRMQTRSSKYFETRSNEREIVNNIRLFLRDRQACENTLAGVIAPGPNNMSALSRIRTSTNLTVFETNNPQKYGLESITMNLTNPFNVGADTRGPFVIEVDFIRSKNATGIKEKTEEILVDIHTGVSAAGGFQIRTCFTDGENNINTAIQEICEQAGGMPIAITDPAVIMAGGGIKWRCEFFDLYLGQHNKKQCQNLKGGASIYPEGENPTHCRVYSDTPGWTTATSSWTEYHNFFSATPKPRIDCQNVSLAPTPLTIDNYRKIVSGDTAGLTLLNYDQSTGVFISDPCFSRSALPYANHPTGAEKCNATCQYLNEETGAPEAVPIPRDMNITSKGFY